MYVVGESWLPEELVNVMLGLASIDHATEPGKEFLMLPSMLDSRLCMFQCCELKHLLCIPSGSRRAPRMVHFAPEEDVSIPPPQGLARGEG